MATPLRDRYPLAFEGRVDDPDGRDNDDGGDDDPVLRLSSLRTLLTLRGGFRPVATPQNNTLYLAEGVVAAPPPLYATWPSSVASVAAGYRRAATAPATKTRDRLFARPQTPPPSSAPRRRPRPLPDFVEKDLALYRIMENSAARFLDRQYATLEDGARRHFVLPLHRARHRARAALERTAPARRKLRALFGSPPQQVAAAENTVDDEKSRNGASPMPPPRSSDVSSEIRDTNWNKGDQNASKSESEPLETILVVSTRPIQQSTITLVSKPNNNRDHSDEDEAVVAVTLYRDMTPSTRILATPDCYVLRHSSASTLVAASLMTSLALPMAYRSFKFSLEYNWLVGGPVVASSVAATVAYYIWNWRRQARVSQGRAVAEALGARVYARDDAALVALREGAVSAVARAVAEVARGDGRGAAVDNGLRSLVDPKELAVEFELMPKDVATEEKTK